MNNNFYNELKQSKYVKTDKVMEYLNSGETTCSIAVVNQKANDYIDNVLRRYLFTGQKEMISDGKWHIDIKTFNKILKGLEDVVLKSN